MDTKDLILPLLAALWGCTDLVFTVTKELNRLRDSIILGHDNGKVIPPRHLEHIRDNDWMPIAWCVAFACLGFSLVAAALPLLLDTQDKTLQAWPVAVGVSIFMGFMGCKWISAACSDWHSMNSAIQQHIQASATIKDPLS